MRSGGHPKGSARHPLLLPGSRRLISLAENFVGGVSGDNGGDVCRAVRRRPVEWEPHRIGAEFGGGAWSYWVHNRANAVSMELYVHRPLLDWRPRLYCFLLRFFSSIVACSHSRAAWTRHRAPPSYKLGGGEPYEPLRTLHGAVRNAGKARTGLPSVPCVCPCIPLLVGPFVTTAERRARDV